MKNLFLLLVASCSLQALAQTNADSLWTIWEDESIDWKVRSNALKVYIWDEVLFTDPDSAIKLSHTYREFSLAEGNEYVLGTSYNIEGVAFYLKGETKKSINLFEQSIFHFKKSDSKRNVAMVTGNLAGMYREMGNDPKFLDYSFKALQVLQELNDSAGIGVIYNHVGTAYQDIEQWKEALDYFNKSLEIYQRLGDDHGRSVTLENIGLVYMGMKEYQMALDALQESLILIYKEGETTAAPSVLGNIGHLYMRQNELDSAEMYFNQQLDLATEANLEHYKATAFHNLGAIMIKRKAYSDALHHCEQALEIFEGLDVLSEQLWCVECLYDASKGLGKANEALAFHEQMILLEDSLNEDEMAQKLQKMEFEKQMLADSIAQAEQSRIIEEAHQEEVRQKKRTRNIFGGVGFFALLLAGGFFWRWRYVRKSKAVLQLEKDRSENLLLNILPEEIAEELKEKGRADARDFENVSILFTDFKGFTAASEKLSAQDLVSEINTCFEAFDGIMGKYGIEKIKTIGDAYMAAGGLPVPTDNSVKKTVLAALEMQDFIKARKAKLDAEGKPGFEMRVGVHTGPVVAGIVGVKKFQYDIWGDTVNTASRMESSGEVGKVNISEATYNLLKDDSQFSFERRGKIEAKGKGEMEMYFVELTSNQSHST